ncbi:MAG TPA: response regulator [Blastocatellia bacterium]|nr:response regulator [Blastocatellia bacterium]
MVSRILLADDSITIQKVVNLTFADEGIEVIAVSNGEVAAKRLEEVNPDLVLADIFMPGKNGYELCEAIKTNSKFRNVPVVLLVGAFEPFDQVEARRVHADAHLTKPFESRTLVETVRKLLGNIDRPHTGPLLAEPPAHQESPRSVEDKNSWLTPVLVDSTSTLEFESASGQWTSADMPTAGVQPQIPETMQLEVGQLDVEAFSDSQSDEIQSSGFEVDHEAHISERPTGELVSPPGGGAQSLEQSLSPQGLPTAALDSLVREQTPTIGEHGPDASLEIETQALMVDGPSASGFEQQKMVVDFEQTLPSRPEAEADGLMLDDNAGVELDVEEEPGSNEWLMRDVQHAANEWRAANAINLNTTKLETPDFLKDDRAPLEANGEVEAGFSFSETTADSESGSLFTAEEPLGDVLSDSGDNQPPTVSSLSEAPLEHTGGFDREVTRGHAVSSLSEAPLEQTVTSEFTLELAPDEAARIEPVGASASVDEFTPHSERTTGELVTAELPMEGQAIVESSTRGGVPHEALEMLEEAQEQRVDRELHIVAVDQSVAGVSASGEAFETPEEAPEQWVDFEQQIVAADESVAAVSSPGDSVSYDWTSPGAVIHSTGRLDSTIMPVELIESSQEPLQQADPGQLAADDIAIDKPADWEAEQMRFTAIDMEASPIEAVDALSQPVPSQRERGFEISPAVVDDQTHVLHENGRREASDLTLSPIELSPMVIDEIVRRVVAQIGDSVVREIAWEIVPDCVERIIEQQTRDALAKR